MAGIVRRLEQDANAELKSSAELHWLNSPDGTVWMDSHSSKQFLKLYAVLHPLNSPDGIDCRDVHRLNAALNDVAFPAFSKRLAGTLSRDVHWAKMPAKLFFHWVSAAVFAKSAYPLVPAMGGRGSTLETVFLHQ